MKPWIAIILLIVIGAIGMVVMMQSAKQPAPEPVAEEEAGPVIVTITDIDLQLPSFDIVRTALNRHSRPLIESIMTADSRQHFRTDASFGRAVRDVLFVSGEIHDDQTAYVTVDEKLRNGRNQTALYVFERAESGEWLLNITQSQSPKE